MKATVGIVTVLFNSDEVLPGFFKSLATQQDVSIRLYVIDNSVSDSGCKLSLSLSEKFGIETTVVFNNNNAGVARGNNQGIEFAQKDGCTHVLLANNDIEFDDPTLISAMLEFSSNRQNCAVVPKIYYHKEPNRIWCAGGRFSLLTATTPHFGEGKFDRGQYDNERLISYAPTCFMLLPINIFDDVGVMDERYFVYYDDSDFAWRMKKKKKIMYYWPFGKIWHKVSYSTGGKESVFSLYYCFRNRIFFVRKHYYFLCSIPVFLYIYLSLVVKKFILGRSQFEAVLKGLQAGWGIDL